MKRVLLFLLIWGGFLLTADASDWVPSYRDARARALKQHKKLLIFFSGSDWCAAGHALRRDLFGTAAFKRLAARKYVLYNADFPKYTRLGPETGERNKSLAGRYGIHSFPAVVLVEPGGGGLLVKQVGMRGMTPRLLLRKLEAVEAETSRPASVGRPRTETPVRR